MMIRPVSVSLQVDMVVSLNQHGGSDHPPEFCSQEVHQLFILGGLLCLNDPVCLNKLSELLVVHGMSHLVSRGLLFEVPC
jgi:hypothetical protein